MSIDNLILLLYNKKRKPRAHDLVHKKEPVMLNIIFYNLYSRRE